MAIIGISDVSLINHGVENILIAIDFENQAAQEAWTEIIDSSEQLGITYEPASAGISLRVSIPNAYAYDNRLEEIFPDLAHILSVLIPQADARKSGAFNIISPENGAETITQTATIPTIIDTATHEKVNASEAETVEVDRLTTQTATITVADHRTTTIHTVIAETQEAPKHVDWDTLGLKIISSRFSPSAKMAFTLPDGITADELNAIEAMIEEPCWQFTFTMKSDEDYQALLRAQTHFPGSASHRI